MRPATPRQQQKQEKESQPYRSTPDSRSSVLNRARQYTRRIEDEERRRSQSFDRNNNNNTNTNTNTATPSATKQSSEGIVSPTTSSTSFSSSSSSSPHASYRGSGIHNAHSSSSRRQTTSPGSFDQTPRSIRDRAVKSVEKDHSRDRFTNETKMDASVPSPSQQGGQGRHSVSTGRPSAATTNDTGDDDVATQQQVHRQPSHQHQQGEPVVSPELLVDALSGHEDGLLAIAERLMEHYDAGYDAMGEAIIDAFADVQKLFQHVVEAAHMEGAAFEASRREEEMKELRRKSSAYDDDTATNNSNNDNNLAAATAAASGPVRHDEFIDQDVKDTLNEAIRKGAALKEQNKHEECYELYEQACQSASALLPVDSDHRGRLQLSIARAESMSPDRACAILRYAMDDVLRSGLRAGKVPLPDPSKRADVVLSKPMAHPSMNGAHAGAGNPAQSSEEALNSLVEEMKEILDAPVYKDTPLQDVAKRFWLALQENQKISSKNEERLEHNLGKLKGDFLLARAEWEEKLTMAQKQAESYKQKYLTAKDGKETSLMDDARNAMSKFPQRMKEEYESQDGLGSLGASGSFRSAKTRPEFQKGVESVASMGSSLAHHAKTLVGSFACAGNNERTGQVLVSERATEEWRGRRNAAAARGADATASFTKQDLPPGLEMSASTSTRSYREAPRHVDV
ncbi:hypothetical protein IV203_026620 [Nitzschia inconspicua]|uniref:Uncharacterized protein n=1 Tax=Nitzschia inconspicua TaxID=303405 RepID=A0A9K3LIY1_9STRA|nr:hypothetical protein IV203_026620 [Nitzschia inconspicua]